jgi:hypothetical protein
MTKEEIKKVRRALKAKRKKLFEEIEKLDAREYDMDALIDAMTVGGLVSAQAAELAQLKYLKADTTELTYAWAPA